MSESYSKLATFEQCPYKYKLIYLDNHYIKNDTIATDFGTLVHHIEEEIGKSLKENKKPDYPFLIDEFREKMFDIENKYPDEFYLLDKSNRTYADKRDYYINIGIYRLEKRVKENNLKVVALEKEFYLKFGEYTFHGFIDRILKKDDQYIDLKTKEKYKILDSEHCYPGNLCVKSNTLIPFEKCLNENHEKVKNNMFKRKILTLYDQIQNGGNK